MGIAKYTKQEFRRLPKAYTVTRTDASGQCFVEVQRKLR